MKNCWEKVHLLPINIFIALQPFNPCHCQVFYQVLFSCGESTFNKNAVRDKGLKKVNNLNWEVMKTTVFIYSIILMLLIAGCKKNGITSTTGRTNPVIPGMILSGYKTGSLFWMTSTPYASVSKKDKTIWIGGYKSISGNGVYDEFLLLQLEIPDLSNLKNTAIKSVEFETIIGGDVVSDRYVVDSTNMNEVTITGIDEAKKIIKGQFNVNLIRDKWFSTNGEKVAFKSGLFVAKYTEN